MADDLIAFLRARLDEDEETARKATARQRGGETWTLDDGESEVCAESGLGIVRRTAPVVARHIARHDPTRVLAEVEAKRLVVDLHRVNDEGGADPICDVCLYAPPCETIRALGAPYADHPHYREEWRL